MIVASRYAKSLLDLSVETGELERVREDMAMIKQACKGHRELVVLLESPVVKTDKKMAIFKSIFADKISKTTLAFLNMIARKRREGYIDDIAYAFDEQYKIHKNITTAVLVSAAKMDDAAKTKLLGIIKAKSKGEVELIEKIDKSLIGGFVLTVGDRQVDLSIRRKLNNLKKDFSVNLYVPDLN